MSKSDVLILPVKEILTPFTGRQMLEAQLAELRKRIEEPELQQVVIMSQQQLLTINRRAAAADYFMSKVRDLSGAILAAWDNGELEATSTAINDLVAFITEGKEPGDEPPEDN